MKLAAAASFMFCLLATGAVAVAQPVYRCGAAYSQLPCPKARVVDTDDARSAAQRREAERVVEADRRLAADMRRDRIADEAARKPGGASSLSGAPGSLVAAPTVRAKTAKHKMSSGKAHVAKPFMARGTTMRAAGSGK